MKKYLKPTIRKATNIGNLMVEPTSLPVVEDGSDHGPQLSKEDLKSVWDK